MVNMPDFGPFEPLEGGISAGSITLDEMQILQQIYRNGQHYPIGPAQAMENQGHSPINGHSKPSSASDTTDPSSTHRPPACNPSKATPTMDLLSATFAQNPRPLAPATKHPRQPLSNIPIVEPNCPPPESLSLTAEEEITYLCQCTQFAVDGQPLPPWMSKHISDTFTANFERVESVQTWDEHIDHLRMLHDKLPEFQVKMVGVSVDISDHNTHADAMCLMEADGQFDGIRRHSAARLKWRRRDGRWELYHIWTARVCPDMIQFPS